MKSLSEQLMNLGLADEKDVREVEAERHLQEEQNALPKKPKARGAFGKLTGAEAHAMFRETDTMKRFRIAAKAYLLWFPERVEEVVKEAHARFTGEEGDKKLFWQVINVRKNIFFVPPDERDAYLSRALRAHNPNPIYEKKR